MDSEMETCVEMLGTFPPSSCTSRYLEHNTYKHFRDRRVSKDSLRARTKQSVRSILTSTSNFPELPPKRFGRHLSTRLTCGCMDSGQKHQVLTSLMPPRISIASVRWQMLGRALYSRACRRRHYHHLKCSMMKCFVL